MSFKPSWKLNTHGIYSQNEFKPTHMHSDLHFRFKVSIGQHINSVSSLCNSDISKLLLTSHFQVARFLDAEFQY